MVRFLARKTLAACSAVAVLVFIHYVVSWFTYEAPACATGSDKAVHCYTTSSEVADLWVSQARPPIDRRVVWIVIGVVVLTFELQAQLTTIGHRSNRVQRLERAADLQCASQQ